MTDKTATTQKPIGRPRIHQDQAAYRLEWKRKDRLRKHAEKQRLGALRLKAEREEKERRQAAFDEFLMRPVDIANRAPLPIWGE